MTDVLTPLYRVQPAIRLYQKAPDIRVRYRFSFYDALIISAAVETGCKTLYSETLAHAQQIEGVRIVNPFRSGLRCDPAWRVR